MEKVYVNTGVKVEGSSNWSVWKFQIKVILQAMRLLGLVEGCVLRPVLGAEAEADWISKDGKAKGIIITHSQEKVIVHVITTTSVPEMWNKHLEQQKFFSLKWWKSVPAESQSIAELIARLLAEEERVADRDSPAKGETSVALVSESSRSIVKCYGCGTEGHYKRDCKSVKGHCHYCKQYEHHISKCRTRVQKLRQKEKNDTQDQMNSKKSNA
nr:uncharacterized protein LOC124220680 isoform X1 [Neodiprion pinetum]